MAKEWYVIHAYSGYENKVRDALLERINRFEMEEAFGDIIVPAEEVIELRAGLVRRKLQKEADNIMQQLETGTETLKPSINFEPGEMVRVIEGPFNDFSGVVEEVNYEKSKVRVAVLIFGRSTGVELVFTQVEKA